MPQLSKTQRLKVFKLADKKYSELTISRRLNIPRATVHYWVTRSKDSQRTVEDLPRSGRPSKLLQEHKKAVRAKARRGQSTSKIAKSINRKYGLDISRHAVTRALHSGKKPLKWLPLTKSRVLRENNRKERLEWCRSVKPKSLRNAVFLDGKVCTLYEQPSNRRRFAYQSVDEKPITCKGKLIGHFFFYAAITRGHKSELFFVAPSPSRRSELPKSRESFQSKHFIQFMKDIKPTFEEWYPNGNYVVIMDKAKQHTSTASKTAMDGLNLPILWSFPAQCWDINCIEHVWAQLSMAMQGHKARTPYGFRRAIDKAWNGISQVTVDKIIANVPKRIKKIVGSDGNWISSYQDKGMC